MMEDIIRQEANEAYPNEAVWLVTKAGYYQVDNVHEDPRNFFSVSLADTRRAYSEGLLKVIHSHCDGEPVPSKADMQGQILMGVPWGVLNTNGHGATPITWWGGETEIPPLEDRPFMHGISDCYSLVRDYHRLQGKDMVEVPRDWQWWEEHDLITESIEEMGLQRVQSHELQEGDIWISQMRNKTPHHCGIFLGNDLILHHPGSGESIDLSKRSVIEPIHRYLPFIVSYWRHV